MEDTWAERAGLGATFKEVLEGAADAIVAADTAGRIVLWNDAAEELFGYPRATMLGNTVSKLISERFLREYEKGVAAAFEAGRPAVSHLTTVARAADGAEYAVEAAVSIAGTGTEAIAVGIVRKIGERFKKLALLRESERHLRDAEQLAGMGSFEWNVGSDEISWSDQLVRIYGYEPGKQPRKLDEFVARVHSDDREGLESNIRNALATGSAWSMDERIIRADTGEERTLSSRVKALKDAQGRVVRLVGICHDVTEQRRAEEQLRYRALHDALTGLPNRDLLLDRLDGALARAARAKKTVAVLFLNLDNFKIVNDAVGHVAGDDILEVVAERLTAVARGDDTVARIGGDEFVIVCENVEQDKELPSFARRVAEVISAPISINERQISVTASIGIALGRQPGAPERLLRDADLAMYHAKQRGKNASEIFDESFRRHATDRVEVEHDLRRALQAGEIVPYYQPIVDLTTGAVAGFEALARWRHPERGVLLPAQFLSVAEESHLIGQLGETMLQQACAQLAQWQRESPSLTMSVNLSALQIDTGLTTIVEQVVAQCAHSRSLFIEVTESVFLEMKRSAAAHLNALARLGVQLGIDDFGTGYSSLLYLKRFPVRFLKIDRFFVKGLPANQEDTAIVEAIVRLGNSLELVTIAEGVETREQREVLRSFGCTHAQGYYFAPPKPAAEVALTA